MKIERLIGVSGDRVGVIVVMLIALSLSAPSVFSATHTWNGTTGDWATAGSWAGGLPADDGDVVITNGRVLLTNASANLRSFMMSNSGTYLTFSNLDAVVQATNAWIYGGTVTHVTNSATATNGAGQWLVDGRVYFRCTNFFLYTNGLINVYACGWSSSGSGWGYGPGAGDYRGGGGYGGFGGNFVNEGGLPYGTNSAPDQPGSGGGSWGASRGGAGGGLVRIESQGGTVVVNGRILANGENVSTGGGSGGGIWISCGTFAATNGTIQANGGNGSPSSPGGGGRIALSYNSLNTPFSFTTLQATRSTSGWPYGDIGTIYLPDTQLLGENLNYIEGQIFGPTSWGPTNLTVSNKWVRFATDSFVLAVSNNLTVSGSTGLVELGGGYLLPRGSYKGSAHDGLTLYSAVTSMLSCGGNLILTNGGDLGVYSGPTNNPSGFGALVDVRGDVRLYTNSWIFPASNPTNGGSVLFMASNLTIASINSGFDANDVGYGGGGGVRTNGYGPGAGGTFSGGGYGGTGGVPTFGGSGGLTYGDSNAPIDPGSGGGRESLDTGYLYSGGPGGGLIRLEVASTLTLEGTLKANGRNSGVNDFDRAGGGSGGGINVRCGTLSGAGSLTANGGHNNGRFWNGATYVSGGTGGGGRIAIKRMYHNFTGSTWVNPGTGTYTTVLGSTGTVVWIQTPFPGTIIKMK